jgi:hypothetical protein
MRRVGVLAVMCGVIALAAIVGRYRFTTEIPEQSILVKKGSHEVKDIVGTFPDVTRLWVWDERLSGTDLLPYWPWAFHVDRSVGGFEYRVTLSIMGSPAEGLKYREKAQAGWRRPQLEEWAGRMLSQFEADNQAAFSRPAKLEASELKQLLVSWFERSTFVNQGIHIQEIVVA